MVDVFHINVNVAGEGSGRVGVRRMVGVVQRVLKVAGQRGQQVDGKGIEANIGSHCVC